MPSSTRRPGLRFSLSTVALLAAAGGAWSPALAEIVPLPKSRPLQSASTTPVDLTTAYAPSSTNVDAMIEPSTPVAPGVGATTRAMPSDVAAGDLKAAIKAADAGDGRRAYAIRNGLSNGTDRRIVDWLLIRSDSPFMTSNAITAFAREAPGWPSPETMRARSESALLRENPPAGTVVALFRSSPPVSIDGARVYARALVASGNRAAAAEVIRRAWLTEKMSDAQQDATLKEFGNLLTQADHRRRAEMLLFDDRSRQAAKLKPLLSAGERAYVDAHIATNQKSKGVAAALNAVPSNVRGLASYKFIQAQYLRRQEKYAEAAQVLLSASRDPAVLVDPDAWWIERRLVSRELLDRGDAATAYKLAATHSATGNQQFMDAEFHAGWYALRFLKDPSRAMAHFKRLDQVAKTPISSARAEYWMGRAAEAQGSGMASGYYKQAAAYGMTYYGQLARQKLGAGSAGVGAPAKPSGADAAAFEANDVVRAIKRLIAVGEINRSWPLFKYLAETLPTPGQVALLAQLAERNGYHHFALNVAKEAQNRGLPVAGLAFPTAGIPSAARVPGGIERPLVYAIARQESTFNAGAVSPVGARGLMQMMPATAAATAKKYGIAYAPGKMNDATYNATLGAAHLDELVTKFDGSYVKIFVAYNAGPGRVNQWVAKYGDPADPRVDVVDWVERIPFSETRNYVQRVMENVTVYRERLGTGRLAVEHDLRGRPNG
jgi:soluble lytic murein transglycosylase